MNCAAALCGRPIERIWCAVKNPIADDPVSNMTELDRRLRINFLGDEHGRGCCVTEKVLVSSYRQTHGLGGSSGRICTAVGRTRPQRRRHA
eukprot:COSAG01_NODE_22302_length_861_cov_4.384514_1_plen_91_part_00